MDLVRRKYLIQTNPDQGENFPSVPNLAFRVLDGYTGVPVGMVWSVLPQPGRFDCRASCFFSDAELSPRGGGNVRPKSGEPGWGKRYDKAAEAIWNTYSRTLPGRERAKRLFWRWSGVSWFVVGAVAGSLANFILQELRV